MGAALGPSPNVSKNWREHEQTIYDFLVRLRSRMHLGARSAVRGRGSRYSQSSPLGGSRAVVPPHQQYRTTYSSWLYRPGHPSPQRYYRVDVRAYGAYPLSRSSASWYYPFCTLIRRLTTPSHEHRLNKITCSIVPRLLLVVETAMRRTQQRCGAHR